MTKPTTSSNRTRIEVNTANIENLKEDMGDIKIQVTNHIPTAIGKVEKKVVKLDEKVDSLAIKLAGVIAVMTFLSRYIIK